MEAKEDAQSRSNGVVTKLLVVSGPVFAGEYRFSRLLLVVDPPVFRYNPGGGAKLGW